MTSHYSPPPQYWLANVKLDYRKYNSRKESKPRKRFLSNNTMLPLNYNTGCTLMKRNTATVTFLESKLGPFRAQYNKATLGLALRTSAVLPFPRRINPKLNFSQIISLRLWHTRHLECELVEITSFKNM